jgi:hypothetical protein
MSLLEAEVKEERWSPVEVLIWIATRSRRFMDALKSVPLPLLEDRLWRLQRDLQFPRALICVTDRRRLASVTRFLMFDALHFILGVQHIPRADFICVDSFLWQCVSG